MIDKEMIQDFIDEAEGHLTEMEKCLLRLEKEPDNAELLNDLFRAAHSIKGIAGLTGLEKINAVSHKMETLMDYLRQGRLEVSSMVVNILLEGMDLINALVKVVAETAEEQGEIADVLDKIERILRGEPIEEAPAAQQEEPEAETSVSATGEVDELERFFIEQAQEKSQRLLAVLDALALDGLNKERLEEGVNECREFFNLAEVSNLERALEPLENMLDTFQQYLAAGDPVDSGTVEVLHKTLLSLMESLGLEILVQAEAEAEAELAAIEEEKRLAEGEELEAEEQMLVQKEAEAEAILEQGEELEEQMLVQKEAEAILEQGEEVRAAMAAQQETPKEVVLDLLSTLKTIKGLGRAKIQAIFDAGYTTLDDLMNVSEEDLTKIKGVTKPLAKKIAEQLIALSQPKTVAAEELPAPEIKVQPEQPVAVVEEKPVMQILSFKEAILDDEYDKELIEIFLSHVNDSYNELVSALSPTAGKNDFDKAEAAWEVIDSLKKAANYMDFPSIVSFMDDILSKLEQSKTSIQAKQPYDLGFIQDALQNIQSLIRQIEETLYPAKTTILEAQTQKVEVEQAEETMMEEEMAEAEVSAEQVEAVEEPLAEEEIEAMTEAYMEESVHVETPLAEEEKEAEPVPEAKAKQEEPVSPKETAAKVKQTLRVDTQKVDALMNQVGELVVNRALFSVVSEEFKARIKELLKIPGIDKRVLKDMLQLNFRLGEATQGLSRVANELQESVMKIRMLPISQLFNRYPRLVRELSLELSKKVTLKLRGENTELDKRVIEQMGDPIVHILRNSIDHGIELPQERAKKGKPQVGTLVMSSYYEGNHVVIRIEDDGRGIDADKLKQKAIDNGLITPENAKLLTEDEALNLMFLPGISTASVVTTTSGRGVGMDVVKKNVEKLNGLIEVVTRKDAGTAFIIKIPLTLAIIQVLVVEVLGISYCIPLTSVVETVRIFLHEIRTIEGREVINLRNSTIPLIRLTQLFLRNGLAEVKDKTFVVIITTGSREVGLVVDGLLGEQEVVIKPLGDYLYTHKEFSGATIMGDGSISLILEVSEIVNVAVERMKNNNRTRERSHAKKESERQLSLHGMR